MARKKVKRFDPGYIPWEKEDMKVIGWCLKNGIGMCAVPSPPPNAKLFRVEIIIKGNSSFSPNFKKTEVLEKQKEYYYYYYNKYKK
jgi:hypothetical protein